MRAEHNELIGVVGAGVIGRGVAHAFARAGIRVVLVDRDQGILDAALAQIERDERAFSLLGRMPLAREFVPIEAATEYGKLADASMVVENIVEDRSAKRDLYVALDKACGPATVFVANTSAITVTWLASFTTRPERVLGIHFMNPVPLKPAVELIRGYHTNDETVSTALALLEVAGKRAIQVADSPGFVSNRVLMLAINEAAFLVHEGVSGPEEVDAVFTECFGHPMGMLATADLIGIDTVLLSIEAIYEQLRDSKFRPCPLLRTMVAAGLLGRKAGRGFHSYPESW